MEKVLSEAKALELTELLLQNDKNIKDELEQKIEFISSNSGYDDTGLKQRVTSLETKSHEHSNKSILDSITEEKIELWNTIPKNGEDGKDGENGANGSDGYSPTVSLSRTTEDNGVVITITDINGTKTETVYDGKDGQFGSGVDVNLSDYYKKTETYSKNEIDELIPDKYDDTQLQNKIAEIEETLTDKAKKTDIPLLDNYVTSEVLTTALSDYAKNVDIPDTSNFVEKEDGKSLFSGSYNDLSDKPVIPSEYDDTALTEMIAVIEETLEDKADKTELHTHANKDILDGITSDKITSWDAKATESFVTNAIAQAQLDGSDVDLSGYATKDDLGEKAEKTHTHAIADITDYEVPDLSDYALKTEIPSTDEFVTEDALNTTLIDYVKTTDIPVSLPASDVPAWAKEENKPIYTAREVGALPDTTIIPSIEGLATEEYVDNAILNVSVDLSEYYKKENVDRIISELRAYIDELHETQQPSEPDSDIIVENEVLSIVNNGAEVADEMLIFDSNATASYENGILTI